jgi:hypothetical protein
MNSFYNMKPIQIYAAEVTRIGREAAGMAMKNIDVDFIRTIVSSKILPPEKVNEVSTQAFGQVTLHKEDVKIKPRTIVGSLLGVVLIATMLSVILSIVLGVLVIGLVRNFH